MAKEKHNDQHQHTSAVRQTVVFGYKAVTGNQNRQRVFLQAAQFIAEKNSNQFADGSYEAAVQQARAKVLVPPPAIGYKIDEPKPSYYQTPKPTPAGIRR